MGKGPQRKVVLADTVIRQAFRDAKKSGKDEWVTDAAIPFGKGGLQFRADSSGVGRWYWRYTAPDGRKVRIVLGLHAYTPTPGHLTLIETRAEVDKRAALYQNPESRDVRTYLADEAAKAGVAKAAAENAEADRVEVERKAADAAERHTLARLMDAYVAHLRAHGKQSAYDAANLVANHVVKAQPMIAGKTAATVTATDIASVLRALVDAGKGRSAGKLRSYLRAAYALAARAETDAEVPAAFIDFGCTSNPVATTGSMAKFNVARERALSDAELREWHGAIAALPDSTAKDALLLGLLLGGQRTAQLVRATVADVDVSERTITLRDPKGRRQQARLHLLPLTDAAFEVVLRAIARAHALREAAEKIQGAEALAVVPVPLLTTDGIAHITAETVIGKATNIATVLLAKPKAERVITEVFRLGDIRRTCETRMAALGISKDARAHIQSHGLGGVQGRHYDKWTYWPEKQASLDTWAAYLAQKPASNVREIKRQSIA